MINIKLYLILKYSNGKLNEYIAVYHWLILVLISDSPACGIKNSLMYAWISPFQNSQDQ